MTPGRQARAFGIRENALLAVLVGLALRMLFVFWLPGTADDSGIYLQLAHNWVDHRVYGLWFNGQLFPTALRVPGYAAYLAGVASVFRRSIRPILLSQAALDMGTCLLAAAVAAALAPTETRSRVAIAALWLAATCPFVANYAGVVLTEVLATFLGTAALTCFVISVQRKPVVFWPERFTLVDPEEGFAWFGSFLVGLAALVRPEMPLLLAAAGVVFAFRWLSRKGWGKLARTAAGMGVAFLLPLTPWAARNLITLHQFQFLAPRYATMPGESTPVGYFAWTRTWLTRYRDVYETVWKIGEEPVDIRELPDVAFDSPEEKARVAALLDRYNKSPRLDFSPEIDRAFAEIARERTRRRPLRTYLEVPFQRALTIWFTPRTELLPVEGKIWPVAQHWDDDPVDWLTTAVFAGLNYLYVAAALAGLWIAWRGGRAGISYLRSFDKPNLWGVALIAVYLLVRTAFLTAIEAPEPRYVVPAYPAVLALAALLWARGDPKES
jgi:4-amino-4-deoxy-L-arabinose transferase-like glycosyltransferase